MTRESLLRHDIRWAVKHAALIGIVLAIACHLAPPQYRVACDALKSLCSAGRE